MNPLAPINSITASMDVSGIPTPATNAVARSTVRSWLWTATDAKIDNGYGLLQFSAAPAPYRAVRGRWWLSLVEHAQGDTYTTLTKPVQLTNPGTASFVLGSVVARMTVGKAVYAQLEYEAASATAAEVVFWSGAARLNITVNMV